MKERKRRGKRKEKKRCIIDEWKLWRNEAKEKERREESELINNHSATGRNYTPRQSIKCVCVYAYSLVALPSPSPFPLPSSPCSRLVSACLYSLRLKSDFPRQVMAQKRQKKKKCFLDIFHVLIFYSEFMCLGVNRFKTWL